MLSPAQRLAIGAGSAALLVGLGIVVYRVFDTNSTPSTTPTTSSSPQGNGHRPAVAKSPPPKLFRGLPTPELVLVLSGEMYGYLQPCGCVRPQIGGLERRYELLNLLRGRGWKVSAADLGDLAPKQHNAQAEIRYDTALQTLQKLDYAAIGLGLTELTLPLEKAFGYTQNCPSMAVLAANLNDKDARFPGMFRSWIIHEPGAAQVRFALLSTLGGCLVEGGIPLCAAAAAMIDPGPRVAYIGVIADSVAQKAKVSDPTLSFSPVDEVLPKALEEVKDRQPDVLVLLCQGTQEEGHDLAKRYPDFHVIVALADADRAPSLAKKVGDTLVLNLGHKGKSVGLVAVSRDPDSLQRRLDYEMVDVTDFFELPDDETNPARELMRDYVLRIAKTNKDGKSFLTDWPRTKHELQVDFPEARYVGATACKECHKKAYAIWSGSRHSHAYENLEKYGRPIVEKPQLEGPPLRIGRQFDPECVRCHTTGFNHPTGFVTEKLTPHLFGNQCENCHGPASLHVEKPNDLEYRAAIRLNLKKAETTCLRCHDDENDPHFDLEKYWPKIRHPRD